MRAVWASVLLASALAGGPIAAVQQPPPPPPPAVVRDANGPPTQRVPVGPGAIAGTVLAAEGGQPVRRARLTLQGAPAAETSTFSASPSAPAADAISRVTFSDDEGRFAFNALPAGRFTLAIEAAHFLASNYGQRKFGVAGASLELTAGQQLQLKVSLLRGGVITGTVFDEHGEPLADASVRPVRYVMLAGYKHLRTAGQATTDNRGVYRVADLEPGTYYVAATPPGWDDAPIERAVVEAGLFDRELVAQRAGTSTAATIPVPVGAPGPAGLVAPGQPAFVVFAPTYYPSAQMPVVSSTVAVEAGAERANVDIHVLPTRTGTIAGTVAGPPGSLSSVQVLLQNMDPDAEIVQMTGRANPDGSFVLQRVVPGQYTVYAQTTAPPGQAVVNGTPVIVQPNGRQTADVNNRLNGRTIVTVTSGATAFAPVSLQTGRSITGSLVFDMPRPPDPAKVRTMMSLAVWPQPIGVPPFSTNPQIQAEPDGTFTFAGVRPGQYYVRASGSGVLKSAVVDGQDILDTPLDFDGDRDVTNLVVTITDRLSELTGTLSNSAGKPIVDYTIIVAPAESRLWVPGSRRVMIARPAPDGRYTFSNLPAGEYMLAAVTEIEPAAQSNPEFLRQLAPSAIHVTIGDHARQQQDLRVGQ